MPRGLLGAACHAIDKKRDAPRTIAKLREHARGPSASSVPAECKVPEEWARFDPSFLLYHLRFETDYDADLIEQMLGYAIKAAAPSSAQEPAQ
ncbi:hypothetical protein D9M69_433620 [compost metagenome]